LENVETATPAARPVDLVSVFYFIVFVSLLSPTVINPKTSKLGTER
jgi:hypothetical protein